MSNIGKDFYKGKSWNKLVQEMEKIDRPLDPITFDQNANKACR